MKELNGHIMSRDQIVATVENGLVTSCGELAPLFIRNTKNIEKWLSDRAIDSHRVNSRLLKKALRLTVSDDVDTALTVNAATITDTYWFREKGSQLSYNDIRFRENMFDGLALYGDPNGFSKAPSRTPELTNTGSFEKCWRLENGRWWMYKSGNQDVLFSELFVCRLGQKLGFDMAYYELSGGYIRTPDFTNGASVNFEPIDCIVGEDDSYKKSFDALYRMSPELAGQYLRIIYLDTLCFNVDRHTKNYGFLRDVETGKIISLAPNYDNNLALISRGKVSDPDRNNDGLIRFFSEFHESNSKARDMLCNMSIPEVAEDTINDIIDSIPIEVDREYVIRFILSGQEIIRNILDCGQSEDFGIKME